MFNRKKTDPIDLDLASEEDKLAFLNQEQQLLAQETEADVDPTSKLTAHNRRTTPRTELCHEIVLRANGISTRTHTLDLGFGGAQIAGRCPVQSGMLLTIGIHYRDQWGAALTRVLRVQEDRFSVKFLTQSTEFMCLLVEVVAPHLPADAWEQCAS